MIRDFGTYQEWAAAAKQAGHTVEVMDALDYPHAVELDPIVAFAGSADPTSPDWRGEVGYFDQIEKHGYLADSADEWLVYCADGDWRDAVAPWDPGEEFDG